MPLSFIFLATTNGSMPSEKKLQQRGLRRHWDLTVGVSPWKRIGFLPNAVGRRISDENCYFGTALVVKPPSKPKSSIKSSGNSFWSIVASGNPQSVQVGYDGINVISKSSEILYEVFLLESVIMIAEGEQC
jgi:hypothetical protein